MLGITGDQHRRRHQVQGLHHARREKQTEEVSKMLKDSTLKDKSGAEPTTAEISTTRLSAVTYCQTVGKPDPDSKTSEALHA
jgi:acid stress chaperone HdeA